MERDWERRHGAPALTPDQVGTILAGYAGDRPLHTSTPLDGGKINCHLRLELGDPHERVVLRVRLGAPEAAAKEARLLRTFSGVVPVPKLLDEGWVEIDGARRQWLLLSWVAGTSLDRRIGVDPDDVLARAGGEAGAALAAVHAHRRQAIGFLDADLVVPEPMGTLPDVWSGYIHSQLDVPRIARRLGRDRVRAMAAFVDARIGDLEALDGHYVLLHADFKPTNLMVDDDGALTGLLDWEFAWSGPPLFDWGQMRRWPLPAPLEKAMVDAYRAAGGTLEGPWRQRARLLDLMNLVGFLDWESDRVRAFRDVVALVDGTLAS